MDFLARHSIVQRSAQVHAKFVSAIQRHHHRQRDHAARLPGKTGAAPDFSPDVTREQVLKCFVELISIVQRCIYVGIPQHGTPHLHSLLIALAFIHQQASSGVQKRCYFSIEPVLIFDIGKVRGVEFSISRTRNLMSEKTPVRRRCSRIVRAGDH